MKTPTLAAWLTLGTLSLTLYAQTPIVTASHDAYPAGDAIAITFAKGPGNPLDWIGIYPADATPGPGSTAWLYVDGTQTGSAGLANGTVVFSAGLNLAGTWRAWLLVNDGYEPAAPTAFAEFTVIDPFAPFLRTDRKSFTPNQPITVAFTNGPANPKDWIGVYPAGVTPGAGSPSLLWSYVDGTGTGTTGLAQGTVAFATGLPNPGRYVACLLLDDGYDILASESFEVANAGPVLLAMTPGNNATEVSPAPQFTARVQQSGSAVVLGSVALTLDGTPVAAQSSLQDDVVTVSYQATPLFAPGSQHTFVLALDDNAVPPHHLVANATFTVVAYQQITLPTPLFFENFDSTPEDQIPAGWTRANFTEVTTADFDLANLDSASFANWTVLNADRFNGQFIPYSNPDAPQADKEDYHRVLTPNPRYVVNGQLVTQFANGRFAFANSGYRNGAAQVQYLYSPDINCTGKSFVYLSFHSLWEQNQDSIAAVEFSIDQGANWLPIAYLLDTSDVILDASNNLDVEATLNTERNDIARYTDPDTGETRGGTYGAFIAAPISPALAPFIQGRVQDNPRDSKRVEIFRLTQADNQSKVRLRFATAGTDSWYWGVDDIGLYSIPPVLPPAIAVPPASQTVFEGDQARLAVTVNGVGPFTYQWLLNASPIPGATADSLTLPRVTPAQAGDYRVEVRNTAGPTLSPIATLTVLPLPDVVTGAWDFNDGDLRLTSGVGSIAFADAEATAALSTFETSDDINVPHIAGQPVKYLHVPALTESSQGYALTMPTHPVPGEGYLNRYTLAWDVLIVSDLNWTPLFNSDPGNGNDADLYVNASGAVGIGALGYSANNLIEPNRWYRIAFAANLTAGRATVYIDGVPVRARTGGSLANGRFALYTDLDAGPDVRLFNEGDSSGIYTHELLVNSFAFTSRELTPEQVAALGGPSAAGIVIPDAIRVQTPMLASGNIMFTWTGGSGPFLVQKKTQLGGAWQTVNTTTSRSFTEPANTQSAFYRIVE